MLPKQLLHRKMSLLEGENILDASRLDAHLGGRSFWVLRGAAAEQTEDSPFLVFAHCRYPSVGGVAESWLESILGEQGLDVRW